MNAIFLRELEKKEKTGGSSLIPKKQATTTATTNTKGDSFTAAKKQTNSSIFVKKPAGSSSTASNKAPTGGLPELGKDKAPPSPNPPVQRKGKRKLSSTSITSGSSPEASISEGAHPSRPSIFSLYTPETAIVGRGPNKIVQKLALQLPSAVDAKFLNSLRWTNLARRTCSSFTEGLMYLGELVERDDQFRTHTFRELQEGKAIQAQLQLKIEEMKSAHIRELEEAQARSDELLKEKDEELQRHTIEIQRLKAELEASRSETVQAHKALKDAKTQFAKEATSFKEDFLKSEEFNEICGPKAFRYLETGFEGTVNLFKAHGYPPEGASTGFISLRNLVASLPPDL